MGESSLLHVARALVANPEVLVIHKPTLFLNTAMGDLMYETLKSYVENRGLYLDPAQFYHRRPRTCIVSARRLDGKGSEVADAVFRVSKAHGILMMETVS